MTIYIIYDMDADGQEHIVGTTHSLVEATEMVDRGLQDYRLIVPRIEICTWPVAERANKTFKREFLEMPRIPPCSWRLAPTEEVYDDIPF